MDYFKNLLIGLVTGIAAYLNPISGEIKSLIAVFALNFICGLLTALLINHESFSFKKAWRCIVEATIFFALVSCIYFIGEHKGNPEGALQCVSFITYSVFYFYGVNILRNIKEILPNSSNGSSFLALCIKCRVYKEYPLSNELFTKRRYQMIEVLEFIFQDFWHWLGTAILIAIIFRVNLVKIGPITKNKEEKK